MSDTKTSLEAHLACALAGDRRAIEALVRGLQDDLYRLALRMLGSPPDAEDALQEILLQIVTHLSGFRGDSSLRTWSWRIATRALLRKRRKRASFEQLEALIDSGAAEVSDASPGLDRRDAERLAEEVRLGCTQAMLDALQPTQRLAYVLGDVFGLESAEAAAVLGVQPAAYRKRLQRARELLSGFMERKCGLVNPAAACRCVRQIPVVLRHGLVDPEAPRWSRLPRAPVRAAFAELREIDGAARVFRERADELAPAALVDQIRSLLSARRYRLFES